MFYLNSEILVEELIYSHGSITPTTSLILIKSEKSNVNSF